MGLVMKKLAYIAMLAAVAAVAPVVAQDTPVATEQDDLSQFTPAQRFGYGMFLVSKKYAELTASPEVEKDPDAVAAKIDELTEVVHQLYAIKLTDADRAELQDIQSKLLVTPEYNDVQTIGAAAATRIKSADYYGSEKLRNSIQEFIYAAMGFRRAE